MRRSHILALCFVPFTGLPVLSVAHASQGDVHISGFVRAAGAAVIGDIPDYLGRIDRDGDAGETEFGINLQADLGSGYVVAGQLWGGGVEGERIAGNGPSVERYRLAIDWAFVTRHFNQGVSISAGKIKFPNLLVSEYVDVGLTYPWVRPPEELYSFETEGPYLSLESFEGASVNYVRQLFDSELGLQLYGGQSIVEDGHLERMMGLKAAFVHDNYRLQLAHNQHLMDTWGPERGALNGETANVTSAGINADFASMLLYAEYAHTTAGEQEVSAYYVTVGYQAGPWLPHLTYASVENGEGWGQTSLTGGVKYQLISAAALKLELKNIQPKVIDEADESGGFFAEGLGQDRGNVVSMSIDVVF